VYKWILAALGVALLALACGPGAPKSGTIVERWYEERREWDETYYVNQCVSYNDKGVCTASISIPMTDHHVDDEDFMVKLEECSYDDSGNRKCRSGKREIPQSDWERLEVGDFYANGNDN